MDTTQLSPDTASRRASTSKPGSGSSAAQPALALDALDHAPEPALVLDTDGRVRYANGRARDMLGYPNETLLSLNAADLVVPWSAARWAGWWSRVRDAGTNRIETRCRTAQGATLPVVVCAGYLAREDGEYVTIVARAVPTAGGADPQLAGIEECFRQLIESSLQGISVDGFDNRPLFVNQAFAELYGYDSPAEIMQLGSLQALVAPEDRARIEAYTRRRKLGRPAPSVYEFTGVRREGTRITVLCSATSVIWDGVPAVQAALIAVTDRQQIEHARREQEAARSRLFGAMEASSEGFALFDARDHLYYTNQRYRQMMAGIRDVLVPGTSFHRILEVSIERGLLPEALDEPEGWIRRRLAMHRSPAGPTELYRADSDIWVRVREQRLDDGATFVVVSDITQAKHSERELADKTEQLQAAYESMDQGIVMLDDEHRIVAFNQRLLKTLALPNFEIRQGLHIREIIEAFARHRGYGEAELEGVVKLRMHQIRSGQPYRFVAEHADGRFLEVRGRAMPSGGHVVTHTDITETHQLSRELTYQASHDSLTGLANRSSFETALDRLIRSARKGARHALCYLDLDQFKVINDTCGHLAGDELLRQLGNLLPEQIRNRDLLARLGGDEFGLLLESCSLDDAARIADKVRGAIEAFRFVWQGKVFRVGTSIGVVPISRYSDNLSDVLSNADAACYAAKDQGRNRVHIYHPDDTDLARRRGDMHWVADLNRSLERNDFVLYQQPIANLRDSDDPEQRFEILVRVKDDAGHLYEPSAFLRSAERFGLMVKLDRWVVGAMLAWLDVKEKQGTGAAMYFINISGMSLRDEPFRRFVIERLARRRASRFRICFEITETAAVASLSSAADFIEQVRELGHCCALDDFGSGLSSFAYLKNLPVDFLKIDGQFVRDITTDDIDLALVKSITEIARVMNKRTIAEFAESAPVVERLRDIGVDFAQGYSVGYPAPLAEPE